MRIVLSAVVLALSLAVTSAHAQNRPGANRAALQRQIVERIITNFANQAALDEAQREEVQLLITDTFAARRQIETRHRTVIAAIEGQLRPGVAADADSLTTLITTLDSVRQELLDLDRRTRERAGAFLNPIQQAQFVLMWERFQRQVETLMRRRMAGNRPGATGSQF